MVYNLHSLVSGIRVSNFQRKNSRKEGSRGQTGDQGTSCRTSFGAGLRQEPAEASKGRHPGQTQQSLLELHHHLRLEEVVY